MNKTIERKNLGDHGDDEWPTLLQVYTIIEDEMADLLISYISKRWPKIAEEIRRRFNPLWCVRKDAFGIYHSILMHRDASAQVREIIGLDSSEVEQNPNHIEFRDLARAVIRDRNQSRDKSRVSFCDFLETAVMLSAAYKCRSRNSKALNQAASRSYKQFVPRLSEVIGDEVSEALEVYQEARDAKKNSGPPK